MNSLRIYFLFLLTSCVAHSGWTQIKVINYLPDQILTMGIVNRLTVTTGEMKVDSVTMTSEHSKIRKENDSTWWVTPDTGYANESFTVKAWYRGKVNSTKSVSFPLQWIPDARVYVRSFTHGDTIPYFILLNAGTLNAVVDFPVEIRTWIVHCEMTVGNGITFKSGNGIIGPAMQIELKNATPGTVVLFHNMKVYYPDGTTRPVPDVQLIVK